MKKKILIILFLVVGTVARGQAIVSEESLKAAFIYRFISFIEWKDDQSDYYICIPDDSVLRAFVEESLKEKIINGKGVVVTDQTPVCHILISDNVPQTDSVFTIGPLAKGALLEFRLVDNKLKFAVSLENIKKSHLKISSQLLKLAIVENGHSS